VPATVTVLPCPVVAASSHRRRWRHQRQYVEHPPGLAGLSAGLVQLEQLLAGLRLSRVSTLLRVEARCLRWLWSRSAWVSEPGCVSPSFPSSSLPSFLLSALLPSLLGRCGVPFVSLRLRLPGCPVSPRADAGARRGPGGGFAGGAGAAGCRCGYPPRPWSLRLEACARFCDSGCECKRMRKESVPSRTALAMTVHLPF
jgi:hypothetical protein